MKPIAGVGGLTIAIDGDALDPEEAACLGGLRVRHALSLPAQCELVFQGIGDDLATRGAGLMGLSLAVRGEDGAVFEGEITAVEHEFTPDGGRELRVRGYDLLHRLRKRQSVEFRDDVDAGELCRQFAGDLGLDADVSEAGPRWPRLAQWQQTDFDLLAGVAARAGLYFAAWDGALRLFTLAGVGSPVSLTLGEELLEASFEVNGDRAWSEVAATGWDPGTGARFEESAGSARSGRSIAPPAATSDTGGAARRTLVNAQVPAAAHVGASAQGELDRATANALTVRGVAAGRADLWPGSKVSLEGFHQTLTGTYVVAEVVHTLDAERGFLSEFSSEVPGPLHPPALTVVAPGVVDRVDDPDSQGRVTVKLPGYHSIETGWMRVMLPAAGADKGFIALPDEGDEVLVLLPNGDPAVGIVLGGMFGKDGVPDTGIVDRRVKRQAWRSPRGHYLEIDDEKDSITIVTANGSTVRMGKDKFTIKSSTDLEIAAPGKNIKITASAVDFVNG
jgi:phage protein D/phage baseplate assembly protein gpV